MRISDTGDAEVLAMLSGEAEPSAYMTENDIKEMLRDIQRAAPFFHGFPPGQDSVPPCTVPRVGNNPIAEECAQYEQVFTPTCSCCTSHHIQFKTIAWP